MIRKQQHYKCSETKNTDKMMSVFFSLLMIFNFIIVFNKSMAENRYKLDKQTRVRRTTFFSAVCRFKYYIKIRIYLQ